MAITPAAAPAAAPEPTAGSAWILVSDIHFNPLDEPGLADSLTRAPAGAWRAILARSGAGPSRYFRDTNFALLESALAEMRARVPNPPVVVVAGDFLGHDFPEHFAAAEPGAKPGVYEAFVDKTIAFLAGELGTTFPEAQFVVTVGNNDGYCDDYAGTPGSPFLAHMAAAFAPLVERGGRAPNFTRDFSQAGYYVAGLPGAPGAQAIVLDSVYWSAKYQNACGRAGSDPGADEFAWLSTELAEPGNPRPAYRWFVTHIPPTIDQYSSLQAGHPVPFMMESDAQRLIALTAAAAPSEFVLGHVHHASFEIIGPGDGTGVPAPIVPSISAVQGNDPAFIAADVVPATGVLRDLTTYVLPLETPGAAWKREYSFDEAYGATAFDTPTLLSLQTRLVADPALWSRYARYYSSGSATATIASGTWPWYWCGALELDEAAYDACVTNLMRPQPMKPVR